MSAQDWWKNLIKGGIAETICTLHFKAASWTVSQTGIEHIVPNFANRMRNADTTSDGRIHEFMGRMPDLLVQHPNRSSYLVEVKFRRGLETPQQLQDFVADLIWHYRHLVFGAYDGAVFASIPPAAWRDDDLVVPKAFSEDLKKNAKRIEPHQIRLPMLFYVVTSAPHGSLNAHLVFPNQTDEHGFRYQTVALSEQGSYACDDESMRPTIDQLRAVWEQEVEPALGSMFPYGVPQKEKNAKAPAKPTDTLPPHLPAKHLQLLAGHVKRIVDDSPVNRKGVYLPDLLKDERVWEELARADIQRPASLEGLHALLTDMGVTMDDYGIRNRDKRYYIRAASLPTLQ